jgi:hypothetical protein
MGVNVDELIGKEVSQTLLVELAIDSLDFE